MSYYNLCGIGHSNISKGKKGGGTCNMDKNHCYARLQSR